MQLVLDCSFAAAWCFHDEASVETTNILMQVAAFGAVVPVLFYTELSNTLLVAERRGRITHMQIESEWNRLSELLIQTDDVPPQALFPVILHLARSQRLTTYDATYLELAVRRGLPLATRDRELADAARRLDVVLV